MEVKVSIGDRYFHKLHGWYEVIAIKSTQVVTVKFDKTSNIRDASKYHAVNGLVADKKGDYYHQVGEKYTNKYGEYEVIKLLPNKRACVRFLNTGTELEAYWANIVRGKIKDYNIPIFYGVGFIGSFRAEEEETKRKAYTLWRNMLMRCYDKKSFLTHPTYADCSVCKEWHNFQIFKKWFDENYIEGYMIDKDILIKGNKVYSPDTCCFVPSEVNALFTKRQNCRGDLPIGVTYSESKKRYKVNFTMNAKKNYIGYFATPEEAFMAYKEAKEAYIKEVAEKWKDKIETKVYDALMSYEVEVTD